MKWKWGERSKKKNERGKDEKLFPTKRRKKKIIEVNSPHNPPPFHTKRIKIIRTEADDKNNYVKINVKI